MTKRRPAAVSAMWTLVFAILLAAPFSNVRSAPDDVEDARADAARAELNARWFEANATVLTIFDRQGNILATIGERGLYQNPSFSPDRTRLAVSLRDQENETVDIWVFEIDTGQRTRITSDANWDAEWTFSPIWSPVGSELAYVGKRDGYEGIYRKASNGEAAEELLYRYPGADLWIGDWSMDGQWLSFSTTDAFGGTLFALPMAGEGQREPVEVFSTDSRLLGGAFSPDARFLSFSSRESGIDEVYVLPFEPSTGPAATSGARQISVQGGKFAIRSGWSRDGKELYYVAADRGIMAAGIDTGMAIALEPPNMLFRLSQAIRIHAERVNVSRDGERIVIAVPHAPKLEQVTVFDRRGTVLHRVGEPGVYRNPTLSHDGKRVAVMKVVPETGNADIWTFDLVSGAGTPITDDRSPDNWPIWSPDSSQIAYGSDRGLFESIFLKASDGAGAEEQVFQYTPGASLQVTDWSADGRFLAFQDGCWGVLHVVPLDGERGETGRQAIEWFKDEYQVAQTRFSPDSRFIAYLTDEIAADEFRIYVSPFNPSRPDDRRVSAQATQISTGKVEGVLAWRGDGKELYYLTPDWEVMAVDIVTTPTFQAGTPKLLFTLPGPLPGNAKQWKNVSDDGERFVFVVNVPVAVH